LFSEFKEDNMPEVKLNEWLQEGFELYKQNFGVLVLSSLVAMVLSGITLGILAGPMFAGMAIICLGLYDKQPRQVGDLFKGFGFFVQTFLFVLVWGIILFVLSIILNIIPLLGQLASMALGLGASALLMFSFFLMVEKGMAFWPASMASIAMVRSNLWPFIGFGALAALIGGIGAIACGIGMIFTLPMQWCFVTVAYREVFGEGAAAQPQAPVPATSAPPITPPPPPVEPEAPAESAPEAPEAAGTTDDPEDTE
jgi:uncharacterized membrane protein